MVKKCYVKNETLIQEVVRYKDTGVMSEELGGMILNIATNYSNKGSFSGYTWKTDMIAEAVLTCVKYLKNFDPLRSNNAFAYVTKICHNSFKGFIKKENRHGKIKDILYKECLLETSFVPEDYKSIDYTDMRFYDSESIIDEC